MGFDLLIPFGILLALVIYQISSRAKFEKNIVKEYEEKFENWKKHSTPPTKEEVEAKRELVGLVFKKNGKIDIELFDEYSNDKIQRGKFTSKINK